MLIFLFIIIVTLLLLNFSQQKEIKKMKGMIKHDEKELEVFAEETYLREGNEVKTIKLLREKYYPLDLVDAKHIVDKIKKPRQN
ncbi:hypothetical protein [Marinilactibacillus sp. Marseille-P9653]|uniref:hypothetical protein n=1 Tax=Marinilactibacillus sp. Marseille-P9653 TaxID=2866583 RepID=UPI001CE43F15|nr:hypothetical protein [Marinilactibacillus sp. Marseille-P9653]